MWRKPPFLLGYLWLQLCRTCCRQKQELRLKHTNHDGPRQSREAGQTCSASIFTADFHCDFLLKEDLRFRDKIGDSGDGEKDI